MKRSCLLIPALLVLGTAPAALAQAPQSSDHPTASVRIVTPPAAHTRWYGVGDIVSRVNLCLTSSTGYYRLTMTPQAQEPSRKAEIDLVYSTAAGERQTQVWDGRTPLTFHSHLGTAPCGAQGNVTLEIRQSQQSLLSMVAGDYAQRLEFAVDPA